MNKILAANRSEIAVRIFRSASELNYRTVALYANEDRFGVHRFKADESYLIGEGKGPVAAYLDIDGIIDLSKDKGIEMIHPGYGFLSENANFAKACEDNGITFIGPSSELLSKMGDKIAARKIADEVGVPTLPGTEDAISDRKIALKTAKKIGFPLIIKAAFGGGGRGMRIVKKEADLESQLDEAQGEAERAFGNSSVFLERYIGRAKHIEVQILGDKHGNVISSILRVHLHLFRARRGEGCWFKEGDGLSGCGRNKRGVVDRVRSALVPNKEKVHWYLLLDADWKRVWAEQIP